MTYSFNCPLCKKANGGFRQAPEPKKSYDLDCIFCKQKVRWVADEATAKLQFKGTLPLAIGFELEQTQSQMLAAVIPKSARLLGAFDQGVELTKHLGGNTQFADGICEGLCLDWIRRVLLDGQTNIGHFAPKDKKDMALREKNRVTKAFHAHEIKSASLNAMANERWKQIDAMFDEELAKVKKTESAEQYKALLELNDEAFDLINGQGEYGQAWDVFARRLANLKKKRPYSDIACIDSRKGRCYDNAAALADTIFDQNFSVGTCILLGVVLESGAGAGAAGGKIDGHAIALSHKSEACFLLFEPNAGVFQCNTSAELKAALLALIQTGWIETLKWGLGKKPEFLVSLFRRKSEYNLNPGDKALRMLPSSQATVIEARAVGIL